MLIGKDWQNAPLDENFNITKVCYPQGMCYTLYMTKCTHGQCLEDFIEN